MCHKKGLVIFWCCVLSAIVVGCKNQAAPSTAKSEIENKPRKVGETQGKTPKVRVAKPTLDMVTDYEEFTGRTEATMSVEIRARVSGYLIKGLKDDTTNREGKEVKKGDILFEIDPRIYEAEEKKAEAALAQSHARFERLTKDFARAKELLPTRSISQGDYDQIAGDYKEAESAVKTAQASLDLAKVNLGFTKVYAPCDGQVSRQMIDPGNMVQADQTPLTTIVKLDPIYAYFDIDERTMLQLRRIKREAETKSPQKKFVVFLELTDEKDFPHQGYIDFADNRIDAMTGTRRLRGVFENPKRIIMPGMFARIRLPIGERHPAILIPEESLGSDQGQRFLYVVNDQHEVKYRRVQIGSLHGKLREIKAGLKPNDTVIVEGLQQIKPGDKVEME